MGSRAGINKVVILGRWNCRHDEEMKNWESSKAVVILRARWFWGGVNAGKLGRIYDTLMTSGGVWTGLEFFAVDFGVGMTIKRPDLITLLARAWASRNLKEERTSRGRAFFNVLSLTWNPTKSKTAW